MIRFLFLLLLIPFAAFSQTEKLEAEFEVMLFSRHVWRGEKMGDQPAVEPSLTLSKGAFSVNVWGAKTFNDSYAELDIIPSYTFGNITLSALDYYNPVKGEDNQFFNFSKEKNRHSLELALNYEASEKLPVNLMWGTLVLGDKNQDTDKPFFSTYLECTVPFSVWNIDVEPGLGMTPFKGYYADKTAIINANVTLGKEFNLSDHWVIPVQTAAIYNPYTNDFFVTIACGIRIN